MIRLGLAGLGVHGSRYAKHLLEGDVRGARLSAVCRSDTTQGRAFAEAHGLAFEPDVPALARRPDVDALILVLRPDLHAGAVHACLDAGKPVLVEKPLATRVDQARSIERRVVETGAPLMVAHTLRFDAVVERLLEHVQDDGAEVDLISINQHFESATRGWIDRPGAGGALLNTAVHGFDLLRHLTGAEPVSVAAETARAIMRRTEDVVSAVVRLEPGGIVADVRNARTTDGRSGRIEVVTRSGQWIGDHVHRTIHRIEGRDRRRVERIDARPTLPRCARAFVEALERGTAMPIGVVDGRRAVEMAEAARESASSGRRIPIGALTDRTQA